MLSRTVSVIVLATAACGPVALAGSEYAYAPDSFAALPDVTVCVVDEATESGLRDLPAKRAHDGRTVLLLDGEVVSLDRVHAPGIATGYAAAEPWFSGDSISVGEHAYLKVSGERRIEPDQITRVGEIHAVPVFASTSDDPPPDAVYLPTRPGCLFQAYVRADLR